MFTCEEIIDYCSKYKIENKKVINKITNQEVLDEDIILKVKSAILLYKDANESYQAAVQQFGGTIKTQQYYIQKTMEKFGVNNEKNSYGINKLINAILSSNGHYEENMSGNDLQNSKFSILIQPRYEYTISYLKLKFRERGFDIEDLKVSQDLSQLEKDGFSRVIIDYKIKKYEKSEERTPLTTSNNSLYQHPRAKDLNELEEQKRIAKQNNDEVAYNYAQSNIERIIRENQVSVSPERWDSMGIDEQIAFVQLKINESKILHDKDSFDYWKTNLINLENKKSNGIERKKTSYSSLPPNQVEQSKQKPEINTQPEKDYRYYYDKLMKAVRKRQTMSNATEEEKKQITGEIFYNQGYLIERLKSEDEIREIMSCVVNDLSGNDLDIKLQNIILEDMQDKLNRINNKSQNNDNLEEVPIMQSSEKSDFTVFMAQLKSKVDRIDKEYKEMLSDGYIDDNELTILISKMNDLNQDSILLGTIVNNEKEQAILNSIVDIINKESAKMITMKNGIEETRNVFRR